MDGLEFRMARVVLSRAVERLKLVHELSYASDVQEAELAQSVGEELGRVTAKHAQLEQSFEALLKSRNAATSNSPAAFIAASQSSSNPKINSNVGIDAADEVAEVRSQLRDNTLTLTKSLKESPHMSDNLRRIASERNALLDTMTQALEELDTSARIFALNQYVDVDEANERKVRDTVQREKQLASDVRELRQLLANENNEHEKAVQHKREQLSAKKSELTEFKVEHGKEQRYVERSCAAHNAAKRREADTRATELDQEAEELRRTIANEKLVHEETVDFLKRKTEQLQQDVVELSNKHDNDSSSKDKELDHLRNRQAREVNRLRQLEDSVQEELANKEQRDVEEAERQPEPAAEPTEAMARAAKHIQKLWRGYKTRVQQGWIKHKKGKGKSSVQKKGTMKTSSGIGNKAKK